MSEHSELSDRRLANNPIAIVGMSGLYPMARSHREYWQNIVDGVDCTEDVPESRWKLDDYYDADPAAPDKTYSRRGAFLPDIDFDPLEFGLPPNQLDVTSTMQTLSLGVARDLLRDAGADVADWYDASRTGVVLGITGPVPLMHPLAARLSTPVLKEVVRSCGLSADDADAIADKYVKAFAPWEENSFPGLLPNVVAGRIANRLALGGMNCTVDAACAASLSAVRTSIAELVDGRADMMLTGGVDTENSIFIYMCFSKVGALSKSGRIAPFDDAADGTLLGEGIGMLALRRLADAERDGNQIYAVIRGLGSSSDGRSKSIYAPRAEGQRLALERAYEDAGCSPSSVELFEAHATGTAVGDRTELAALAEVLHSTTNERQFAALGSVKSQIGHTKGAAGTASLMKLAFALYHKVLPPTINVEQLNSAVDFAEAPYYVNIKTRPWVRDPHRPLRRAAASAMGFGGTNYHVVLEEHAASRPHLRTLHRTARVHLWHAPDTEALIELVRSGAASHDGAEIPADHARAGFVASDAHTHDELHAVLLEQLTADVGAAEWSHPRGVYFRRAALPNLRVGALFAGQGSQYLEMGLEAVLNNPVVAEAIDRANMAFDDADIRLATALYPPPVFDAEQRQRQEAALRQTEYTQPAIGALSAGQFRFLTSRGLSCAGHLGHSFGELTALWASGALSDSDFVRLARARGAAMSSPADEEAGTMAAVNASRDQVTKLLDGIEDVLICNHNAPDQVVVGGGTEGVEQVLRSCAEQGITARPLAVSAAFHTPYVSHAVDTFRAAVVKATVGQPHGPVYANAADASYGPDPAANADTLVTQLLQPVEFVAALEAMRADGCTVFVEFGPKQVLTSLVQRTLGADVIAIPTDAGPLGDSDVALKQAALRLAVLGVPLTGINRDDAPELDQAQPTGMTVRLSAPEYVSPQRSDAYQAALTGGYQVSVAAPAGSNGATAAPAATNGAPAPAASLPPAPTPTPMPASSPPPTSTPAPRPAASRDVDRALHQQVAVHSEYLEGQLRVAEQLAAAVRDGADPALVEAVTAVKDHSVAIGQAHTRANEILAELAGLELGTGGPPASTSATALPVTPASPVTPAPATSVPAALATVTTSPSDTGALAPPDSPAVPAPAPSPTDVDSSADSGVLAMLLDVVAEKTGYPADMVDPSMDLEADLGVDSIKRVQVLGTVQQRKPGLPVLGPEQLGELRTLQQIADYLEGAAAAAPKAGDAAPKAPDAGATTPRHQVQLVPLPPVDLLDDPYPPNPVAVLIGADDTTGTVITGALEQRGWTVRRANRADDELTEHVSLCLLVLDVVDDWDAAVAKLAEAILVAKHAAGPLTESAHTGHRAAFATLTRIDGGLGWHGRRHVAEGLLGGVGGIVKTLAAEAPNLFCRAVDLDPRTAPDEVADVLLTELYDAATDTLEVGVDTERRRHTVVPSRYGAASAAVSTIAKTTDLGEVSLGDDELLVVTGGARGVTALCVCALAEHTSAEFLLLGRTQLSTEPEWAVGVADLKPAVIEALRHGGGTPTPLEVERTCRDLLAQREIRDTLAALGDRARYLCVDVTDAVAVRAALAEYRHRVTGFVHGAGTLADALLPDKTADQISRVFDTKLGGARAVLDALDGAPLRRLVFFTSVAGLLGNPGQADYAAANEALCRLAASWRFRHPDVRATAIDWGAWDGGMVTQELRELFIARGVPLLDPRVGARAFVEQFAERHAGDTCVLVGADMSLAGNQAVTRPAFTAHRTLTGLAEEAVVQAHRIGAHPVLPATFGLGWLIGVLERAHPGLQVTEVRDFQVHKGIVFDGTEPESFRVEAEAGHLDGDQVTVHAAVRSASEPATSHYAAAFVLAPAPAQAPRQRAYLPGAGPEDALEIYQNATQFHGPRLHGMRRVLDRGEGQLVLECRLADAAAAGFQGRLHSPVLTDLLLQAPPVLGKELLGQACLPLGIGHAAYFAPLPDDEPFVVVVDDVRVGPASATMTATAAKYDGSVLQQFADVTVVSTPDMTEKFHDSVRTWREEQ